ncbi:hypothetical protein C9374_007069 [Naegleria lovaniensis]|uniref:Probable quinone oxidoreductase n=1 Tax=Naegleria lovaniensis TaxID=51637 RepID=A0AA88H2V5_NAELO|nr:uncharacterized protein C9374_007069 [Naegleria lovaniensis]KAG2393538.1 hypothetical protein C9374_007069 [Naegleria lovaniensis]
MKACVIHHTGDASVLKHETDFPKPLFDKSTSDQILIRVVYAGVNFIDTYFRSGLYPVPSFPKVLGQDGSGYIEEIGDQVPSTCGLKVGDRVAFTSGSGSYAEYVLSGFVNVVKIPDEVSFQDAAACMVQGLTAYYLAFDIPSARNDIVLVHAAAGGTGRVLVQILSKIKKVKTIIGTVGSDEKISIAKDLGCTHVIQYKREDVVQRVKEITNQAGVDVVYDGVGKDTYSASLNSLGVRGLFISFGNASGPVPPILPLDLSAKGSLTFTRPRMGDFVRTHDEMREKSEKVFSWVSQQAISMKIHKIFKLEEAADAHREIEDRKTLGKILLKIASDE